MKDSAGTGEIGVRDARGHFSSLGDEVKGSPGAAVVMAMGVDTDGFKVQSRPRDFKTWMCSENRDIDVDNKTTEYCKRMLHLFCCIRSVTKCTENAL